MAALQPPWQESLPVVSLATACQAKHLLFIAADSMANRWQEWPFFEQLNSVLERRRKSVRELQTAGIVADLPDGSAAGWISMSLSATSFSQSVALRKLVVPILAECPDLLRVELLGTDAECEALQSLVLRVLLINGIEGGLRRLEIGPQLNNQVVSSELAMAESHAFTCWLTALPPNVLTPEVLRDVCVAQAERFGWSCRVYKLAELRAMGAGCFAAVASGSDDEEQCIVHLQSRSSSAPLPGVALVGKGVCFDTGGYNLKSDAEMQLMHEDMGGAAVALGLMASATLMKLPLHVDLWLAIADNRVGPRGYVPQSVLTALNGLRVEVIDTDSEGRLLLADAMVLACRNKDPSAPTALIDFATLTGAMLNAMGTRMSGVFTNHPTLANLAREASVASCERMLLWPLEADYDEELRSDRADLCNTNLTAGGGAIFAARFLSYFVGDLPWMHVDLSAARHKGGLGAVGSDVTGWGVYWGVEVLNRIAGLKSPLSGSPSPPSFHNESLHAE